MTTAIAARLSDPATSDWLKAALLQSLQRDMRDATRDAEDLATLLREREDEVLAEFLRDAKPEGKA